MSTPDQPQWSPKDEFDFSFEPVPIERPFISRPIAEGRERVRQTIFYVTFPIYLGTYVTITALTLSGVVDPTVGVAAAFAFTPVTFGVRKLLNFYLGGIDRTI